MVLRRIFFYIIITATQTTDYPKKLDEIEKLHLQEIREIEHRMQN